MLNPLDVVVRFVLSMLIAALWQAPLFALGAWAMLRIAWRANATTRHSVFTVALVASVMLPFATATLALHRASSAPTSAIGSADDREVRLPRGARSYVPVTLGPSIPKAARAPSENAPPTLAVPAFARTIALPRSIAVAIVAIWFACAGFLSLRLVASLLHLERLKRDSLPLGTEYRESLTRWSAAHKGSRGVRLCRSNEIDIPIAVGLFDAMILVPTHLLDELPACDIDAIVLHELAHLRRYDDWINAVESVAGAVMLFNPGIVWLAARLDLEREVACDDWVLQQSDALPYAACLAKVAESAVWPRRAMTAPGVFATRRGLSIRIERLLAKHRDVRVRTSFGLAGATVVLLGALGFVAAVVSPSIAYDVASSAAPSIADIAPPRAPRTPQTPPAPGVLPIPPIPPIRERLVAEATDPSYIEELARVGYAHLSLGELVRLRSVGVTADDVRALARSGLVHPSVADLTRIKAVGVESDFIADMRARFGSSLAIERILGLRALGVSREYVDALSAAGVTHLTPDRVMGLRALDVDADFVRRAEANGFPHPDVEELLKLKATGIL